MDIELPDLTFRRGPHIRNPKLEQQVLSAAWECARKEAKKHDTAQLDEFPKQLLEVLEAMQHIIDEDFVCLFYEIAVIPISTSMGWEPDEEGCTIINEIPFGKAITELAYKAGFYETQERAWLDWYWSYQRLKGGEWSLLLLCELFAPVFTIEPTVIQKFLGNRNFAPQRVKPEQPSFF